MKSSDVCPQCGAPFHQGQVTCEYCGYTSLQREHEHIYQQERGERSRKLVRLFIVLTVASIAGIVLMTMVEFMIPMLLMR